MTKQENKKIGKAWRNTIYYLKRHKTWCELHRDQSSYEYWEGTDANLWAFKMWRRFLVCECYEATGRSEKELERLVDKAIKKDDYAILYEGVTK